MLHEDARSIGFEARQRVHNLSRDLAERQEAGDYFGRLRLSGRISRRQYEAGNLYARICIDYRFILPIKPVRSPSDLNRSPGYDASDGTDPEYVARVGRIESAYFGARSALLTCGEPLAQMAVDGTVLDGRPMNLGALRVGLNALAREFRIPADGEAA